MDLYKSRNGADETALATIKTNIATKENELSALRTEISTKQAEANKLVSTWQSTAAGISVGNEEEGLTRQITNVAAGTKDTDAVNVAQLKKAQNHFVKYKWEKYSKKLFERWSNRN